MASKTNTGNRFERMLREILAHHEWAADAAGAFSFVYVIVLSIL